MARLFVEVVYARADGHDIVVVELEEGARAIDAVAASGLFERYPQAGAEVLLGVYGKEVPADALLADGDRVEIYRRLVLDPKEARRARARGGARKK
jgi:putative ubiquitin-RnfH superfamily antitoxin RatB of RatAB toxin-antitoxin module